MVANDSLYLYLKGKEAMLVVFASSAQFIDYLDKNLRQAAELQVVCGDVLTFGCSGDQLCVPQSH